MRISDWSSDVCSSDLLASAAAWVCGNLLGWSPRSEILAAGIATFAVTAFLLTLLPDFLIRFVLWMLTHTIYRIRIVGAENVPSKGAALLVCNHLSFVDGLLVERTREIGRAHV